MEQQQVPRLEPEMPNGMEKVQVKELERRSKLNVEELSRIEDEDVLDKMVPPPLLGCWARGPGAGGTGAVLTWVSSCSWIRRQTLRSGD